MEATASQPECLEDTKALTRGRSYIVFDPYTLNVIAHRIEPEDESDFRPLLDLIAGTNSGPLSSTSSPAP
jgi:hypothetical protein